MSQTISPGVLRKLCGVVQSYVVIMHVRLGARERLLIVKKKKWTFFNSIGFENDLRCKTNRYISERDIRRRTNQALIKKKVLIMAGGSKCRKGHGMNGKGKRGRRSLQKPEFDMLKG